ncbi:MAG: hypothetical protein L0206_21360 [Actinobacteria bacterium]|nr:hypothetical protein [Actinomycetota bacterium]
MRFGLPIALALAACSVPACQGRIAPLSAQQGSTILIPLMGDPAPEVVGYGGTLQEDYQRGTLVYQLDGPGGEELVTRASSAVLPSPSAAITRDQPRPKSQIVSLVDIPEKAPLGTHTLHVVRRRIEGGEPVDYPGPAYNGPLTILPQSLIIDVDGTPVEVFGETTPFERWDGTGWVDATDDVPFAIPRPELRITLANNVRAVELRVDYDPSVVDVVDAFEPPVLFTSRLATVWYQDDEAGTVRVSAVAPSTAFFRVSLVYTLVDGASAILDPADVDVTIEGAWDQNGSPITTSVVSKTIY